MGDVRGDGAPMISSLRVTGGYAKKLPALKRPLAFGSGLTVLFGPNGCGKTTALRIAGAYAGCPEHGGWPAFVEPVYLRTLGETYPEALAHHAPRDCTAEVGWDGSATFLYLAGANEGLPIAFGMESDGLTSDMERIFGDRQMSSGQRTLLRLNRIAERLKAPPDLAVPPPDRGHVNDQWRNAMEAFSSYVSTLPRTGPATLLLDEPDRSLSIPVQSDLWRLLPKMATSIQVLVASHSAFALRCEGATVIEMEKGYVDACRKALDPLCKESR